MGMIVCKYCQTVGISDHDCKCSNADARKQYDKISDDERKFAAANSKLHSLIKELFLDYITGKDITDHITSLNQIANNIRDYNKWFDKEMRRLRIVSAASLLLNKTYNHDLYDRIDNLIKAFNYPNTSSKDVENQFTTEQFIEYVKNSIS